MARGRGRGGGRSGRSGRSRGRSSGRSSKGKGKSSGGKGSKGGRGKGRSTSSAGKGGSRSGSSGSSSGSSSSRGGTGSRGTGPGGRGPGGRGPGGRATGKSRGKSGVGGIGSRSSFASSWSTSQTGALGAAIAASKIANPGAWAKAISSGQTATKALAVKAQKVAAEKSAFSIAAAGFNTAFGQRQPDSKLSKKKFTSWHDSGTVSNLQAAIDRSKEANPAAWGQVTGERVNLGTFTSALTEAKEKSFDRTHQINLNPAHVTKEGKFNLAEAMKGFFVANPGFVGINEAAATTSSLGMETGGQLNTESLAGDQDGVTMPSSEAMQDAVALGAISFAGAVGGEEKKQPSGLIPQAFAQSAPQLTLQQILAADRHAAWADLGVGSIPYKQIDPGGKMGLLTQAVKKDPKQYVTLPDNIGVVANAALAGKFEKSFAHEAFITEKWQSQAKGYHNPFDFSEKPKALLKAEADTSFWRTLALQEANLAYSVKKNEAGENVYTYGTEKIPTGMMFSSDMYNTDGSLKSKEQISEKTVTIDPDTGVATYNVPKFQGLDPNFAIDPKDMKQFKGQEESGIKSIFRTEEFTQKDPDTGLDKTYITSAYDPSKESPGSSAVFDPYGLKGTEDQSVLGGKWVLKRNIWSEIPAGAHSVDSKTVAQWEGGYSDIPTKMVPEAPRTWDPKTGEQESGPKEAPYGKGIVPIATPISGELTPLKERQLALTAKTGETTYNPDGTISTMMKMPSIESAEYWSKVGGVIDKPVDEYSGNILIGKTTEKVHPDPVYISDREAELKMLYSDQGLSIPWYEPKREVVQMDDGVLTIIPYKMDPQRPVYQTLYPDVLQPDYVQPEQPQAVAPEPYEVPYYVDIPKATEMLQSGMTIEQIMERPPLSSEYMYWTDPYDKNEYVMSHDEHQEYLTELVKQKKIEKRRKYEDIFMDVTPSMRAVRIPRTSAGRAAPAITRTRMGSNAPPEADIGGLVR